MKRQIYLKKEHYEKFGAGPENGKKENYDSLRVGRKAEKLGINLSRNESIVQNILLHKP